MTAPIKVARYHLADPAIYLGAPWALLGFTFAANFAISALQGSGPNPTKAVVTIFVVFFILGVWSISRSLPFGLALGVSRRSYYLGTAGLGVVLAAVDGLALTGLQAIERATGHWGVGMYYFDVHYFLTGAWYLTWLSCFVGLTLLFVYGMWFALVYQRWDRIGLLVFIAGQVTLVLGVLLVASSNHSWHRVGHFFTKLTAAGLTGVLAALAAALVAGGFAVMRRVTV